MSIAWVFPGQGSQKIGMADSVIDLPGAQDRFSLASQFLGRDLLKICRGENKESQQIYDLNDTRNTQIALFVVESLLIDDLRRQGREAALFAGHSLGEIVALYAANVLDLETSLKLLHKRSELMASSVNGSMTAVLGFDRNQLDQLVNAIEGVVIANDNSSAQVVLSGIPEAIESVIKNLKLKRAIPLQVSGAFHSPLMENASQSFAKEIDLVNFNDATAPVLSNAEPTPTTNGLILKERLKKQMTSGVRWRETMELMISEGINSIVEIGPGNVLSGLAKRSIKDVSINQISSASDLGH
tara:strand:+ start:10572 stop:11468 length:897 start_codon:yes stop_codon:yes gene_type:complete